MPKRKNGERPLVVAAPALDQTEDGLEADPVVDRARHRLAAELLEGAVERIHRRASLIRRLSHKPGDVAGDELEQLADDIMRDCEEIDTLREGTREEAGA